MNNVTNSTTDDSPQIKQSHHSHQSLYPKRAGYAPNIAVKVGGVVACNRDIEYNVGRHTSKITVRNRGDRPIQVGSHFHFFEVNRYLEFDRVATFGCHLNIPATTAIRFEPGDSKEVEVVRFGGKQRIIGFNSLVEGYTGCEETPSYYPTFRHATDMMKRRGFKCATQQEIEAENHAETKNNINKKQTDKE